MRLTRSLFAAFVLCEVLVGSTAAEQITSACRITAVDQVTRTITLVRNTPTGAKTGVAKVADNVDLQVGGKAVTLDALKAPIDASIVYDTELRAVVGIKATDMPSVAGNEPPRAIAPFDAAKAKACQEAWAKHLGVPIETTNSVGMKLVLIPPGEFDMGASEREIQAILAAAKRHNETMSASDIREKEPQRTARINWPLYMGSTEVTIDHFQKFVAASNFVTDAEKDPAGGSFWDMAANQRSRGPGYSWRKVGYPQEGTHPVVNVSWNDSVAFCRWLSTTEDREYRLPSEIEWEYACRAGTTTAWTGGDQPESLRGAVNFRDLALQTAAASKWKSSADWSDGYAFTAPVGTFRPNAFGLHDMLGNAFEYCQDWARGHENTMRCVKGGGFITQLVELRAPRRTASKPQESAYNVGFRVVCECRAAK